MVSTLTPHIGAKVDTIGRMRRVRPSVLSFEARRGSP
jgi:hypothetical protein